MKLFHKIEAAVAIVRFRGGVHKQLDMYARGRDVYIPHAGGYLRVGALFGDAFGTANPDIKVLEFASTDILTTTGHASVYNGVGA